MSWRAPRPAAAWPDRGRTPASALWPRPPLPGIFRHSRRPWCSAWAVNGDGTGGVFLPQRPGMAWRSRGGRGRRVPAGTVMPAQGGGGRAGAAGTRAGRLRPLPRREGRSRKPAGEFPEPVDVGEGGDQADRGPRGPGGLPVDHLKELLVAQPVFVFEGGRHLLGGEAERGLADAGVAVAAAAQRDSRPVGPALGSHRVDEHAGGIEEVHRDRAPRRPVPAGP